MQFHSRGTSDPSRDSGCTVPGTFRFGATLPSPQVSVARQWATLHVDHWRRSNSSRSSGPSKALFALLGGPPTANKSRSGNKRTRLAELNRVRKLSLPHLTKKYPHSSPLIDRPNNPKAGSLGTPYKGRALVDLALQPIARARDNEPGEQAAHGVVSCFRREVSVAFTTQRSSAMLCDFSDWQRHWSGRTTQKIRLCAISGRRPIALAPRVRHKQPLQIEMSNAFHWAIASANFKMPQLHVK